MGEKVIAEALSRKNIRDFARELRGMLHLQEQLYIDVLRILEMVLPCIGVTYEIVPFSEMQEEGRTFPGKRLIQIREDVYAGAVKGVGRDRYTIAHEIGHLFLHDASKISFARADNPVPRYCDPEWQADAFAGEFLVPYDLVDGMSVEEVSEKCGVSFSAARVQLNAYKK